MIILLNHFEDKDTIIAKINGKVIIANGCQIFDITCLDAICEEFDVSDKQKQECLNAIKRLDECADIEALLCTDRRFADFLRTDQLHQTIEKTDNWIILRAVARSEKVTTELLQQIKKK